MRAPLPVLTPWQRFHWEAGADGVLRVQRCAACGRLVFPPGPRCTRCGATDLVVDEVSGREATPGVFFGAHSPKMIIRALRGPALFSDDEG